MNCTFAYVSFHFKNKLTMLSLWFIHSMFFQMGRICSILGIWSATSHFVLSLRIFVLFHNFAIFSSTNIAWQRKTPSPLYWMVCVCMCYLLIFSIVFILILLMFFNSISHYPALYELKTSRNYLLPFSQFSVPTDPAKREEEYAAKMNKKKHRTTTTAG